MNERQPIRHNEIMPTSEVLAPFRSVIVWGLGQTGRLFFNEASSIDGLNVLGKTRSAYINNHPGSEKRLPPVDTEAIKPDVYILTVANPADIALSEIAEAVSSTKSIPLIVLTQNGVDVVPKAQSVLADKSVSIIRASLFTAVSGDSKDLHYDPNKLRIAISQVSGQGFEAASHMFEAMNFKVQLCPDYIPMEWTKLLINTIGTTGTITGLPIAETFADQDLFRLELKGIKDRMAIMRAMGYSIVDFSQIGIPTKLLTSIMRHAPAGALGAFRNQIGKLIAGERSGIPPSAFTRIVEGKKTEVLYYHQPFVDSGVQHGFSSPVDEAILKLVHLHENHKLDLVTMPQQEKTKLLLKEVNKSQ
jgi:ketopantoate reductase